MHKTSKFHSGPQIIISKMIQRWFKVYSVQHIQNNIKENR